MRSEGASCCSGYLWVVPPHVVHHLQDVQLALVALRQALQDLMEPGQIENLGHLLNQNKTEFFKFMDI